MYTVVAALFLRRAAEPAKRMRSADVLPSISVAWRYVIVESWRPTARNHGDWRLVIGQQIVTHNSCTLAAVVAREFIRSPVLLLIDPKTSVWIS